jgi:hypothetical protein
MQNGKWLLLRKDWEMKENDGVKIGGGWGGPRQGGGRKPINSLYKRELVTVRLPAWMTYWLRNQPKAGRIIEEALIAHCGLKGPPKPGNNERGNKE